MREEVCASVLTIGGKGFIEELINAFMMRICIAPTLESILRIWIEKVQEGLPKWINNVNINLPWVTLNKSTCSIFNFIHQVILFLSYVKYCQPTDLPQVNHIHFCFPHNPLRQLLTQWVKVWCNFTTFIRTDTSQVSTLPSFLWVWNIFCLEKSVLLYKRSIWQFIVHVLSVQLFPQYS